MLPRTGTGLIHISIHAPREGGDRLFYDNNNIPIAFQSTPPARGATPLLRPWPSSTAYFNPRPPRGGRLFLRSSVQTGLLISIHAPREGGDYSLTWCGLP